MPEPRSVAITVADYLYFVDRALAGMQAILVELGDDLANTRPPVPGANTPFALVTHCLGVVGYWAGSLVGGRPVERDRAAEFTARGRVADLTAPSTAPARSSRPTSTGSTAVHRPR